MDGEVSHQRKTWKRFMKTILSRLPAYVEKYPPAEQTLLTEFLNVLQHFEEADFNRKKLSNRFDEFDQKYYLTEQYYRLPFLWFTHTYLTNANLLLSVSRFHADIFKEYWRRIIDGRHLPLVHFLNIRGVE